jgi:uncharacterized protein YbjT (DUF2867 family)
MNETMLVVGASGRVGSAVLEAALARGAKVRALVRPGRPRPRGAEAAEGDLGDPVALRLAMEGVRGVFFITPHGPDEERHGLNVIAAAQASGVQRLVYSSAARFWSRWRPWDAVLAQLTCLLGPHYRAKVRVDAAVRRSGLDPVVLRPTNFFQNDELGLHRVLAGAFLQPFGQAHVNRVDVRDIAELAAKALWTQALPAGTYPVVGPRALTSAECVLAWNAAGVRVADAQLTPQQWAEAVRGEAPAEAIADFVKTFTLLRRFGYAPHARDLEATTRALGHPPRSYAQYCREAGRAAGSRRVA